MKAQVARVIVEIDEFNIPQFSGAGVTPTGLFRSLLVLVLLGACQSTPPESAKADDEAAMAAAVAEAPAKQDRQSGYYYPPLTSRETYTARAQTLKGASRNTRLGFVTALTKQQLGRHYAPNTAIFAKGEEAEKLIIVALETGVISTLYQGRALLAQLTAMSRLSPLFSELGVQGYFTFFDLAKLLGFKTITLSDGAAWSHQIVIQ